jgi:hypothetical protein
MGIIGTKVRQQAQPKMRKGVIWFLVKKTLQRCFIIYDFARSMVDQINSCKEGVIPVFQGHRSMGKKG